MPFTADTWNSFRGVPTWLPWTTNHASNFNTLLDIVERPKLVQIRPCRLVKTILPIWLIFFKVPVQDHVYWLKPFPSQNHCHLSLLHESWWVVGLFSLEIHKRSFTWSLGTVLIRFIGRRVSSLILMKGCLHVLPTHDYEIVHPAQAHESWVVVGLFSLGSITGAF
jgi:hypothetical protein